MTDKPERVSTARAEALVYRDAPDWDGRRAAAIGGIFFESADAGQALLAEVAAKLRNEGFEALLGPMDGDTWHRYRLVAESDGSRPFVLEPTSGPHDREVFVAAGFSPVSSYTSARARLVDTLAPEPVSIPGIVVTQWDGTGAEQLITQLFNMSASSFAGNHFFKPITLDAFLELYRPVLPLLDPRHILFAHTESGQLVGFLFGMPDRLASTQPAAILKTYASGRRGVGHLLADNYHRRALELGFTEVIHALMHEDNASRDRSERHKAKMFRRYELMGLLLQQ
jgi:hypothetical protein